MQIERRCRSTRRRCRPLATSCAFVECGGWGAARDLSIFNGRNSAEMRIFERYIIITLNIFNFNEPKKSIIDGDAGTNLRLRRAGHISHSDSHHIPKRRSM
jgi:hypothetical protein